MAKSLTAASVEKHKPNPTRRREIPDGRMPGLYLIVQPSGAKSWAVRYRHGGKARKLTIGPYPAFDLGEAREQAQQALNRVQRGGDPAREKRLQRRRNAEAADDFEAVVRLFIERYAKKKNRSWPEVARSLGLSPSKDEPDKKLEERTLEVVKGGVVAKLGERKIGDIRRADVITLLDDIEDRGAPIQANRTLAHIRKVFNWAIARGLIVVDGDLIAANPCAGVKPPGEEKSRDRVLSDDELKAIWKAATAMQWPFGPIVLLLLLTGQRREEVAGMRWSELNLDFKLWVLPRDRVKNDTEHVVPLSETAVEIIKSLPRVKNVDFLFSTTGCGPVSGFSKAKDRLDGLAEYNFLQARGQPVPSFDEWRKTRSRKVAITDWRFHDIRRTVASGMAKLKIALPVAEKVLNHVSGSFGGIVGVYNHYEYDDEKRSALEAWARFVTALVSDKPADNVIALHG
jgi:integrase